MKPIHFSVALALLLLATVPAVAIQFNKFVSAEEAKKLGVTITSHDNGDVGARVDIHFSPAGEFKQFLRVELEIRKDGQNVFYGPLETSSPTPATRTAQFSTDPSNLANCVLSIVVLDNTATRIGYQFRVKDFVELKK